MEQRRKRLMRAKQLLETMPNAEFKEKVRALCLEFGCRPMLAEDYLRVLEGVA